MPDETPATKSAANVETVAELMALWPSISDFARDINLKKPSHGTVMKLRGSIDVDHWPAVIAAAEKRAIADVTADLLMKIHARERTAEPVRN